MSIMECEGCGAFVDTDHHEMDTVKGKEVCENCANEDEETVSINGWGDRIMNQIAPDFRIEPKLKGSCFSGRSAKYPV